MLELCLLQRGYDAQLERTHELRILLPDDDPKTFQVYAHWLYSGTLPVTYGILGKEVDFEYLDLVKAYVLGDKLLDDTFRRTVIDAIVEASLVERINWDPWFPGDEAILYAYSNTLKESPIRKLLVDFHVYYGDSEWIGDLKIAEQYPKSFLIDLSTALLDRRKFPDHGSLRASGYYFKPFSVSQDSGNNKDDSGPHTDG